MYHCITFLLPAAAMPAWSRAQSWRARRLPSSALAPSSCPPPGLTTCRSWVSWQTMSYGITSPTWKVCSRHCCSNRQTLCCSYLAQLSLHLGTST